MSEDSAPNETPERHEAEDSLPSVASLKIEGSPKAVSELIRAIGKARAEMEPVLADTQGQFQNRTFKYADLASIYRSALGALNKFAITVFHPNCQVTLDVQRAVTMLAGYEATISVYHDFRGDLHYDRIKGFGAMLTFINRYQTRGLLAVAGDDDLDNNAHAGTQAFSSKPQAPQGRAKSPSAAKPQPAPAQNTTQGQPGASNGQAEPVPAEPPKAEPAPEPGTHAPMSAAEAEKVVATIPDHNTETGEVPAKGPITAGTGQLLIETMRGAGVRKRRDAAALLVEHCGKGAIDDMSEAEALALLEPDCIVGIMKRLGIAGSEAAQ